MVLVEQSYEDWARGGSVEFFCFQDRYEFGTVGSRFSFIKYHEQMSSLYDKSNLEIRKSMSKKSSEKVSFR